MGGRPWMGHCLGCADNGRELAVSSRIAISFLRGLENGGRLWRSYKDNSELL